MAQTAFRLFVLFVIALAAAIAVVLLAAPAQLWRLLAGDPDLGPVDFATLRKTDKPNQYLVCPQTFCQNAEIDRLSNVYAVDARSLKAALDAIAMGRRGVEKVAEDATSIRYVTRSAAFKFPDTVSVRFYDLEGGSSLAIYARAQLGYADFGANQNRVERWLKALEQKIPPKP